MKRAFTLIELLTSLGVLALLLSLLLPGLSKAREQAKAAVCGSNLRQLGSANGMYALDQGGMYVPGAAEFVRNLHRWHGSRAAVNLPFDSKDGPLNNYLGQEQRIRACPTFTPPPSGFEIGNGGYGYNNAYVGVVTLSDGKGGAQVIDDRRGASLHQVLRPAETVMFTDAAFAESDLIEYSFAEPRFHPQYASRADPSIHFRHQQTANVAWCDGRVTAEKRTFSWFSEFYEVDPVLFDIGWFGTADDNSLFDLR